MNFTTKELEDIILDDLSDDAYRLWECYYGASNYFNQDDNDQFIELFLIVIEKLLKNGLIGCMLIDYTTNDFVEIDFFKENINFKNCLEQEFEYKGMQVTFYSTGPADQSNLNNLRDPFTHLPPLDGNAEV